MPSDPADLTIDPPHLVHTTAALDIMLSHLREQPRFAVDTESDSLYRYYPKVCLIQVSTCRHSALNDDAEGVTDYLVDPLQMADAPAMLADFGALLADEHYEVIMHAAENDIYTLQRDFGFTFRSVYDTQIAARCLDWPGIGLAKILEAQFGVISNKRMQRTDWGVRPLTLEQTVYAQKDTHYLLELRERQVELLKEAKQWRNAQNAFKSLEKLDFRERTPHERTWRNTKGYRRVPRKQQPLLQALWAWREEEAQVQDVPPFKIAHDRVLVAIATVQPRTTLKLSEIDGFGKSQVRRYGDDVLRILNGEAE